MVSACARSPGAGCGKPAFFNSKKPLFEVHTKTGMLYNTDNGTPMVPIGEEDLPRPELSSSAPAGLDAHRSGERARVLPGRHLPGPAQDAGGQLWPRGGVRTMAALAWNLEACDVLIGKSSFIVLPLTCTGSACAKRALPSCRSCTLGITSTATSCAARSRWAGAPAWLSPSSRRSWPFQQQHRV